MLDCSDPVRQKYVGIEGLRQVPRELFLLFDLVQSEQQPEWKLSHLPKPLGQ